MIHSALAWLGQVLAGPLMDLVGDYFKMQTDHNRIQGEVTQTRDRIRGSESISTIQAETSQLAKRPLLVVIAQCVLWVIALTYYGALVVASVWPALGLVVQQLPTEWELLTLAILASLAGPYLLNLLKNRFIR